MPMLKKIFNEPLTYFVLIGAAIFLLYGTINNESELASGENIIISDSDIDRLVEVYERTWSNSPDSTTLRGLIQNHLDQEMMYLEGLKLNLDHNDEIIKRRLVQKYEFLVKDLSSADLPTTEELRSFYQEHPDRYLSQKRISFQHFYFSPDIHEDPLELSKKALKKWSKSIKVQEAFKKEADPFFISSPQQAQTIDQLWQNFGKKFGDEIMNSSKTGWTGPIESGLGWHVVFIDAIVAPEQLSFDEVQSDVERDFQDRQLIEYNTKIMESLRDDYDVQYELDKWKKVSI